MEKRTIILLCPPRCGSTAILKAFERHPDVGICHKNLGFTNFEPNFWNTAAKAIAGNSSFLKNKIGETLLNIPLPDEYTEESVFQLWDAILDVQGPIVVDKSPFYLGNKEAIKLLAKYIHKGNDVRIFSLIRDPRDSIISQFEIFNSEYEKFFPQRWEDNWLLKYAHLDELTKMVGFIPLFRYEDIAMAPSCYMPIIFYYCGIRNLSYTYDHIKPVHIGRNATSIHMRIRKWRISKPFKEHLIKYGYIDINENLVKEFLLFIRMLPVNIKRLILTLIRTWNLRYEKKSNSLF